jgi:hypothetical protein
MRNAVCSPVGSIHLRHHQACGSSRPFRHCQTNRLDVFAMVPLQDAELPDDLLAFKVLRGASAPDMSPRSSAMFQSKPDATSDSFSAVPRLSRPFCLPLPTWAPEKTDTRKRSGRGATARILPSLRPRNRVAAPGFRARHRPIRAGRFRKTRAPVFVSWRDTGSTRCGRRGGSIAGPCA